ncbi:MAG: BMP family ABC transporter substrate-binding protein [Lachnospiraceae bacterium]|nr:BMP family ABC transporter substrate-binding protein [Lachnospiraceae bacterium]
MKLDYEKAKKLGEREYRRRLVKGQYPYLPSLDEMVSEIGRMPEISLGTAEIPMDMIVGTRTSGRKNAFAANFMPLMGIETEFAAKWSRLYDSQVEEGIRDPIKVYEFMNRFYVEEGNKRVSVMKFVGAVTIPANVIRIRPPRTDSEQSRLYYEYLDFYKVTKSFEIVFSAPGRYEKLARILEQNLQDPWPEELLEKLHAGLIAFKEIYYAKGGRKLNLTIGDALLIYLSVYSLDSLLREGSDEISRRLLRLWREYIAASQPEGIALIEKREDAETVKKKSPLAKMADLVGHYSPAHPLKIAFVHERSAASSGWVYGHMLGMNHLKNAFGSLVQTMHFDNCTSEEEIRAAFDTAREEGCGMIFTTASSLMPFALRFAVENPAVKVLNCGVNQTQHALRFYYGKMYEAKFILGALAASLADDHQISYRASKKDATAIANVNAFAIGAQLTDPCCRVRLHWIGEESRSDSATPDYREKEIHVFSDIDIIRPDDESRRYGVFMIDEKGNFRRLAASIWNWGAFYELIVRKVLDGTYDSVPASQKDRALNYFLGISSGIIDVILSDDLPRPSFRLAQMLRKGIAEGRISPFEGVIFDREGKAHGAEEAFLSTGQIMEMDWFAENIDVVNEADTGKDV